jgi:FlgD Ig-like domain
MNSQRSRLLLAAAAVLVYLVPMASQAIVPYSQDYEILNQLDAAALENDGWLIYGNVYDPLGTYLYGYGAFPAPNHALGFCQIDLLQGGLEQGVQQLSVFSDYNNLDHANGNTVESNVFQEQDITAEDVGKTWKFTFDAKMGNLVEGVSPTATAFIKTLNPVGWATTNLITIDMTNIPIEWTGYSVSLAIDASLEGQKFQFGFANTATLYESSGIFYDNVVLAVDTASAVPEASLIVGASLGKNYPNPFNPTTRIDFSLDQPGNVGIEVYDVAGHKIATLHQGSLDAGDHHVTWNGQSDAGVPAASGRYNYVLRTAAGQTSRSMILVK